MPGVGLDPLRVRVRVSNVRVRVRVRVSNVSSHHDGVEIRSQPIRARVRVRVRPSPCQPLNKTDGRPSQIKSGLHPNLNPI